MESKYPHVQGWDAAARGDASCTCPYAEGTEEHKAWRSGHAAYLSIARRSY